MGNTVTAPAVPDPSVFLAACSNNRFSKIKEALERLSAEDRATLLIQSKDKEGRTCLITSVIKGHCSLVDLLLENGANVHATTKAGTALHEAAARKNLTLVDLLLRYGGNPFETNAKGMTAMELAVLAGASKVVRRLQQEALFAGAVDVQWSKLGGLTHSYKPRYVVILPHSSCVHRPSSGSRGVHQPLSRQMWIYSSRDSPLPKCRLWLDGAGAYQVGNSEAILRLHASFPQPSGKVYTRFARGYCLFLRATAPKQHSGGSGPHIMVTNREAQASWSLLLHTCRLNPTAVSPPSMKPFLDRAAASGSLMPVGSLPPPPATVSAPTSQVHLVMGSRPGTPITPSQAAAAPGEEGFDDVDGLAPLPSLMQSGVITRRSYSASHAISAVAATTPPHSDRHHTASPGGGRSSSAMTFEGASALPGESDADFAARLAAITLGGSMPHPPAFRLNSERPMSTGGVRHPPLIRVAPAAGSACGSGSGGGSTSGGGSISSLSTYVSSSGGCSSVVSLGGAPSGMQLLNDPLSMDNADCCSTVPSAPPLPVEQFGPRAQARQREVEELEAFCVICLIEPPRAGFLHGKTVHRCVCLPCSKKIKVGDRCPMCREKVENVLGVF